MVAETSDYYSIAVEDESAVTPGREMSTDKTKATLRQQRIAAAIERSKSEYKAEHAYTERNASIPPFARENTSVTKAERQKLESAALSWFNSDNPLEHSACLQLIHSLFEPSTESRSLGGLSRELMDVGLQSAIACGDIPTAISLAKQSGSLWKGQFVGTSACAADALVFGKHHQESLAPLLMAIATCGLQYPILCRLSFSLQSLLLSSTHVPMESTSHLLSLVKHAMEWRSPPFKKNIFAPHEEGSVTRGNQCGDDYVSNRPLDTHAVAIELNLDRNAEMALVETWKRLSRGLDVVVQQPEKSVRDL
ncbi:hypothetical protein IAT38_004758 [Cryptococcus sp. DSM 104549]